MPQIIPIKDLKNTSEISALCMDTGEPVFVTKNGYGHLVIMSIETYEKKMFAQDVAAKLEIAEKEVTEGKTQDARQSLRILREKHGI